MRQANETLIVLVMLLLVELALLRGGQRRLFWATVRASRSRLLAYVLAAPGTALHEGAHYLACRALGVAIVGRVRLFWPTRGPGGELVLGSVSHVRTGVLRQALISVAPLVLVPAALALATTLLLFPAALVALPDALGQVPWWRAALWLYISLSCGQAAFPSPGDRIGLGGSAGLVLVVAGAFGLVDLLGGRGSLRDTLGAVDGILALPAATAAVSLLVLRLLSGVARPRY